MLAALFPTKTFIYRIGKIWLPAVLGEKKIEDGNTTASQCLNHRFHQAI